MKFEIGNLGWFMRDFKSMNFLKKWIYLIFMVLLFLSCNDGHKHMDKKSASPSNLHTVNHKELTYKNFQARIKAFNSEMGQLNCDLPTITKQIHSFAIEPASIPIAEEVVNKCALNLTVPERDSLFLLFVRLHVKVENKLNDSLDIKYESIFKMMDKDISNSETKDFKRCLGLCGFDLLMTEGSYYVDQKYNYMYDLFRNKVSPDAEEYLKIRSKEMKEGFSEDAGLLISFDRLYNRVANWEDFIEKNSNSFLLDDAKEYYQSYLSTLLTGMDNSPVFDENNKLDPELKLLYEKIIKQNKPDKSTKIISEYYNLLKANNFQQSKDIDEFLKANGLYSMLSVQPDTR